MTWILLSLPYLISFFIGYLFIHLLFLKEEAKIDPFLLIFLAGGLGLAISAQLTFYSFVFCGRLNKPFVMIADLSLIAGLIILLAFIGKRKKSLLIHEGNFDLKSTLCILAILLGLIPLYLVANVYPLGGWDAWSSWNLKAKFLYLGGGEWKNVFDPLLWRSSPHYPLLLPLINVWGWSFFKAPLFQIPLMTSIVFPFLATGLLFSSLKSSGKMFASLLAPYLMLSSLFFIKLAGSQYADIVFGYYLLASIVCLIKSQCGHSNCWVLLSGIFLGILSFSKLEGLVATLLLVLLAGPYLLIKSKSTYNRMRKLMTVFLTGLFIFSLPTILFYLLYAPANQTFINGLISQDHPANFLRVKMVAMFMRFELVSSKWNGIWILLGVGLLISKARCFKGSMAIIPAFLFLYGLAILTYYFINTYFEIGWWLQVSLNRILFALLPTVIYWVFYSVWQEEQGRRVTGSQSHK